MLDYTKYVIKINFSWFLFVFYFLNMATRKLKITYKAQAHIIFLLNSLVCLLGSVEGYNPI